MYHFIITDNKIYPKVVYPAIANLVERLSGAKPAGEFNQRDRNGLQGYFFRMDGKILRRSGFMRLRNGGRSRRFWRCRRRN